MLQNKAQLDQVSEGARDASEEKPHPYYAGKVDSLCDLFGTPHVTVHSTSLVVKGLTYPIINDVIVLLPSDQRPAAARNSRSRLGGDFDPDVQEGFGQEWTAFPRVMPDHAATFMEYFDLVDLQSLGEKRLLDLGCGMGRWSYFAAPYCREIVLVDFSDAIFIARDNLASRPNALFFMGDVLNLPFRGHAADLAFSLGVLHHTPVPALEAVRRIAPVGQTLLIYLYYRLDNRARHFRLLLKVVDAMRRRLCRIRNPSARQAISFLIALLVYRPLVGLGVVLRPLRLSQHVPLYDAYRGKRFSFLHQDAYDRFFTSVEQRVTREEILGLLDTFADVVVSDGAPYWHFLAGDDLGQMVRRGKTA